MPLYFNNYSTVQSGYVVASVQYSSMTLHYTASSQEHLIGQFKLFWEIIESTIKIPQISWKPIMTTNEKDNVNIFWCSLA